MTNRKEILKAWSDAKWFEYFIEDITILLNKNRDSLANLDLFDEKDRAKGIKTQANITAINEVCNYIKSYSKTNRVIQGLDPKNFS